MPTVPTYSPEVRKQFALQSGIPEEDVAPSSGGMMGGGMSDEQFAATYDPAYKRANPFTAVTQSKDRYDSSLTQMGEGLYGSIRDKLQGLTGAMGDNLSKSYPHAAGTGALVGAGLGAAINFLKNRLTGSSGGYGGAMTAGGLVGGISGAGLHYNRNQYTKQASFSFGDVRDLESKIMDATGLSVSEKRMLLQAVQRLSDSEKQNLKRLLGTAFGASIGAIVTRFLFSKGLLPMAIGGIIGGAIGHRVASSRKTNSLGQFSY